MNAAIRAVVRMPLKNQWRVAAPQGIGRNAMHKIQESEIVPYTKEEMFELVVDADRYQEFLPWCKESRIVSRENNTVVAEFKAKLGPVSISFTTRNELHPSERVDIHLLEGPFEVFEGSWRFSFNGENSSKIEFRLRFKVAHEHLGALFDPIFKEATETITKAFKERAQKIYG
jgi:ribosome-associated toxin RatA of RatAB toxin-antitoxin module